MAPARRSCRRLVAERTRPPALCVGHCDRLWHVVAVVTAVLSGLESQPGAVAATVLRPHGRGQLSECRCCVHARLPSLTCSRTIGRPPGSLSARSIQFGIALAPSLPHWLQRMRWPNDGTGTSSGLASTLTSVSWPRAGRSDTARARRGVAWCRASSDGSIHGVRDLARTGLVELVGTCEVAPPDRPRKAPLSCGRELAWASAGIVAYGPASQESSTLFAGQVKRQVRPEGA